MFEKLRPLHDKILVKRLVENNKTAGGIIIPDTAKDKAQTAEVIAIGTGKLDENGKVMPMQVKKGDKVFIGKYSGTEASDEFVVIREDEILGILD